MAGRGKDATLPAWLRAAGTSGVVPGASSARSADGGRPRSRSRSRERGGGAPGTRSRSRSRSREDRDSWGRGRSAGGGTGGFYSDLATRVLGASAVAPVVPDQRLLLQNAMTAASVGSASADAVRRAKRLYVGGLPPCSDSEVAAFFNATIAKVYQPGDHIVSAFVHPDKQFAFVEFRDLSGACWARGRGRGGREAGHGATRRASAVT